MPQGIKKSNEYAGSYPGFTETPKSVLAAIAFSLAMRISGDNPEDAAKLLRDEWAALHANGIVPQKPK